MNQYKLLFIKILKKILKFFSYTFLTLFLIGVIIMLIPDNSVDESDLPVDKVTRVIEKHYRGEDQTYLTYPEWFLVFSPEEFASFSKENPPHKFNFKAHVSQLWEAYDKIKEETKNYKYNDEYHTMIKVIGYSTAIEYKLKSFYESIFGRFSWFFANDKLTSSDLLMAQYSQEYVDFIKLYPWYKFDFINRITPIWKQKRNEGDSFIRSIERKLIHTLDYSLKAVYGRLIGWGAKGSYERPIMYTLVKTDKIIDTAKFNAILDKNTKPYDKCSIANFNKTNDGYYLFPRYQPFTACLRAIQEYQKDNGYINITQIAGNEKIILLSVLTNNNNVLSYGKEILRQPLITKPNNFRVLIMLDIHDLDVTVNNMINDKIEIEHIFDF